MVGSAFQFGWVVYFDAARPRPFPSAACSLCRVSCGAGFVAFSVLILIVDGADGMRDAHWARIERGGNREENTALKFRIPGSR